jgi:hypothetical protein
MILCIPFFFLLVDSVAGSLLSVAACAPVVEFPDPAALEVCDDDGPV